MNFIEKFKKILRKYPPLYKFIQSYYGKARLLKEYLMKTDISEKEEKRWEKRRLKEGKDWATKGYWGVRNHPATSFLLEKIKSVRHLSSILEVGCNCGPNLYLIAKNIPNIEIKGIDINKMAVQKGRELFKKEEFPNVELFIGKAQDLSRFPNKSFDVVFAKAVLVHIGPAKIKKVAEEITRVAKKRIILIEQQPELDEDMEGLGIRLGYSHRWKRNYSALFKEFIPNGEIKYSKVPKEIWDGDWDLIEITF